MVVIALAGRRIDASDEPARRFPLEHAPLVRERLRAVFLREPAQALVCSAACGADLMALEVAEQLGLRFRIILPTAPERFRETSVVDRPGEWGGLFDQVIGRAERAGDLVVLPLEEGSPRGGYERVNAAILDEAVAIAGQAEQDGTPVVASVLAVVVWDGTPRGSTDFSAAFLLEAHRRGLRVVTIATL